MLELNKREYTKNLKKPSFEEDEAENGYQNDTQENNVTMDSETDGARYVLEFEYTVFFVTFVRYVQKTTSPICLNFKNSRDAQQVCSYRLRNLFWVDCE